MTMPTLIRGRPWLLACAHDLMREPGEGDDGLGAVRGVVLGLVMSSSLWLLGVIALRL